MKKVLVLLIVSSMMMATSGCGLIFRKNDSTITSDVSTIDSSKTADDFSGSGSKVESVFPVYNTENLINSMSSEEKRLLNTFLSNFSEGYLQNYNPGHTNNELIQFGFIHHFVNDYNSIVFKGEYMGISSQKVNYVLDKYMGITIASSSSATVGTNWHYNDGYFLTPLASGASYDYFSIATEMYDNGNGTYTVKCNTYFAGKDRLTKEHYKLTDIQAGDQCDFSYNSVATIKKKIFNGNNTYELISLEKNYF